VTIDDSVLFDRRFSAVAFTHPRLPRMSQLVSSLDPRNELEGRSKRYGLWTWRRVSLTLSESKHLKWRMQSGTRFELGWFVATRESPQGTIAVLIHPYVAMLKAMVNSSLKSLSEPAPSFIRPDLNSLFDLLAEGSFDLAATRLSLRLTKNNVDLVSLSGGSPLISSLYSELRSKNTSAVPYDIRLQLERKPIQPFRFYMTRHGNYFFNLVDEDALKAAFHCFDFFIDRDLFAADFTLPHLKED
jgi:hypothetical protein